MNLFIIGAFENPELIPTPTHVFPVVVSHSKNGYLRIFYDSNGNTTSTPGNKNYCEKISDILPYSNIIRLHPIRYNPNAQTILLSSKKIISSQKKLYLIAKILPYLFTPKFINSARTIINILK